MCNLLGLAGSVNLTAQAGGGRAGVREVSAEHGDHERSEDDIGAPNDRSTRAEDTAGGQGSYRKTGRDSHRRKTNLKVK